MPDNLPGVQFQEDWLSGHPILIDATHHEIHEGDHFYVEGFTTLDSGVELNVKLVTPNTTVQSHFRWTIGSSGILQTYLYEGVSGGMSDGSAITPLNSNRNSSNTSGIVLTSGVTAPADYGVTISQASYGSTGFKSTSGGSTSRDDELVLKMNTTYLRRFISYSDANIVTFRATWYELDSV